MLNIFDSKEYDFRLRQRRIEKYAAVGIGGEVIDILPAKNIRLDFGSTRIKTRFLASDISVITRNIYKRSGIKITGLIGSDVMKKYGVVIDYKKEVIGICTS